MSDIAIVKAMELRQRWRSLASLVPTDMLVPDAKAILSWYGVYFKTYQDKDAIDHDLLLSLIKTKTQLTQEQWVHIKQTVERLRKFDDTDAVEGIVDNLLERDLEGRAGALLEQFSNGVELDLGYELGQLVEATKRSKSNSAAGDYIQTPVSDILLAEGQDHGLKFPTQLLKDNIKGVLGGSLTLVAARPGAGKSSLLSAILAEFVPQLDKYFDSSRPMLWLNNEGSGERIVPRIYSAVLKKTSAELLASDRAGTLNAEYTKAAGRADRIRIRDIHGATLAQIEQIIQAQNPCVVVFDMVANIRSGAIAGGNKTDDIEAKWQAIRELAVQYDFVAIGTIQVSTEGDNMLYPGYGALKDSKTSVQGAVDIMLMMGKLNDPSMAGLRGISTVKNKFNLPGKPETVQGDVIFVPDTCQFLDGA